MHMQHSRRHAILHESRSCCNSHAKAREAAKVLSTASITAGYAGKLKCTIASNPQAVLPHDTRARLRAFERVLGSSNLQYLVEAVAGDMLLAIVA